MTKLKNITLFFSPILVFTLITLLVFQRQQLKGTTLDRNRQARLDSLKMDQFYRYVLNYGGYVPVPLRKEMLVSDSLNRVFKVGQLINHKKYIYHFDETNCFTCVERFMPYLKRIAEKAGKENVLIFGSFTNSGNLFLNLRGYNLEGIPVYNLDPVFLKDTKLGELNAPYIFLADSLLQADRFYIPEKAAPELSELYLKNI